jgi:hypothetical protein
MADCTANDQEPLETGRRQKGEKRNSLRSGMQITSRFRVFLLGLFLRPIFAKIVLVSICDGKFAQFRRAT